MGRGWLELTIPIIIVIIINFINLFSFLFFLRYSGHLRLCLCSLTGPVISDVCHKLKRETEKWDAKDAKFSIRWVACFDISGVRFSSCLQLWTFFSVNSYLSAFSCLFYHCLLFYSFLHWNKIRNFKKAIRLK